MTKERFTTPVGRLVQGDVDEPQTKDAQGNPRVVKTGPNAGQPNPQYFIAVAFPKADPQGEFSKLYGLLLQKAAQDFPNLFPNAATGDYTCVHPQFSFKVIDGDGRDANGKSNAEKEGFAGHWVLRLASGYPPRIFDAGKYGPHDQIQEKGFIKRGYYVRVSGTVEGNGNAQRPGLYVNLDMVERSAFGPEIVGGPDASDAFGGGPAALPAGASATPVGQPNAAPASTPPGHTPQPGNAPVAPPVAPSSSPGVPASPPPAAPPVAPVHAPTPPAAVAPSPGAASPAAGNAPPYDGYMGAAGNPAGDAPAANPAPPAASTPNTPTASPTSAPPPAPPAPPAAPPAAPTGPQMLPAANGATYEQMIAAGWTDDTLRQHGMMA